MYSWNCCETAALSMHTKDPARVNESFKRHWLLSKLAPTAQVLLWQISYHSVQFTKTTPDEPQILAQE